LTTWFESGIIKQDQKIDMARQPVLAGALRLIRLPVTKVPVSLSFRLGMAWYAILTNKASMGFIA
jgi:hypothetical protein